MKRALIRTDEFLVWRLKMQAGERKIFRHQETNRGLTDHGPLTLSAISVFVTGKFATIRHGRPPYVHEAGTGGANSLDADSWLGHSILCLEDGEYHCITPIGPPRFWSRRVFSARAGDQFRCQDEWVYNASVIDRPINIKNDVYTVDADSVIVRMWLDEPKVPT